MLENLFVSNFRSHEKSEFALNSGLNIFLGEVGAGKTSILEAVSFSLFGKISANITQTELIKRGTKQAKVILDFSLGKEKYRVERTVSIKKPQKAKLWIYNNNSYLLAVEGSNAVSKSIEGILGVDSSTFLAAIYASQGEIKEMLQTQPGKRREQFDKLLGIDIYEKLWDTMGKSKSLVIKELLDAQKKASGFDILTKQQKEKDNEIKEKTKELNSLKKDSIQIKQILNPKEKTLIIYEELKKSLDRFQIKIEENLKNSKKIQDRIESLKQQIMKTTKAEMIFKNNIKYIDKEENLRLEREKVNRALQQKININRILENEKRFLHENDQKRVELEEKIKNLPDLYLELKQLKEIKNNYQLLKSKKKNYQHDLDIANEKFIKNNQKQEQETEKIERISLLGKCPTCMQKVSAKHKNCIKENSIKKQHILDKKIKKWGKKREQIQNEIQLLEKQIDNSEEAIKKFERINVKIEVLEKAKDDIEKITHTITSIQDRLYSLNWELSGIKETKEQLSRIEDDLKKISEKAKVAKEAQLLISSKYELESILSIEYENLNKIKNEEKEFQKKYQEIIYEYNSSHHEQLEKEVEKYKEQEARTNEGIKRIVNTLLNEKEKLKDISKSINEKTEAKEKLEKLETESKILEILRRGLRDVLQPAIRKNSVIKVSEEFQQFYQALSNDNIDYAAIDEDGNVEVIRNGEPSPINTLSGGETTCAALALRLSICSSLTKNQLLLLDEPTIHLDEIYRAKLRDFLTTHTFDQLIVVTHDNTFDTLPAQILFVEKKNGESRVVTLKK